MIKAEFMATVSILAGVSTINVTNIEIPSSNFIILNSTENYAKQDVKITNSTNLDGIMNELEAIKKIFGKDVTINVSGQDNTIFMYNQKLSEDENLDKLEEFNSYWYDELKNNSKFMIVLGDGIV